MKDTVAVYWDAAMADTAAHKCGAARSSIMQAETAADLTVKRRWLKHGLDKIRQAEAQVLAAMRDLENGG